MTVIDAAGFTLVEMSFVLVIIGVLMRAAILPLTARVEQQQRQLTYDLLARTRHALIGHLVTTGALPCPLTESKFSGSAGLMEAPVSATTIGRACESGSGYVPANLLGVMGPTDEQGALLDAWGRRLRYTVSLVQGSHQANGSLARPSSMWTTAAVLDQTGIGELNADLSLCRSSSASRCSKQELVADQLVFVLLSVGADSASTDQQVENQDNDRVFVLASQSSVPGYTFDDHLVWASKSELAYWLLRAGR
ncbi:MAG: prepilin-type N-terminal cleavage/methylation domain-containing protein [Granulosicoccus sp.]